MYFGIGENPNESYQGGGVGWFVLAWIKKGFSFDFNNKNTKKSLGKIAPPPGMIRKD